MLAHMEKLDSRASPFPPCVCPVSAAAEASTLEVCQTLLLYLLHREIPLLFYSAEGREKKRESRGRRGNNYARLGFYTTNLKEVDAVDGVLLHLVHLAHKALGALGCSPKLVKKRGITGTTGVCKTEMVAMAQSLLSRHHLSC